MGRFVKAEDVKALLNGLESLPWEEEVDDLVDNLPGTDVLQIWGAFEIYEEDREPTEDYIKERMTAALARGLKRFITIEKSTGPAGNTLFKAHIDLVNWEGEEDG